MRRPGRDARRRNRNIGTAKAGHGQNNKMRIPEPRLIKGKQDVLFYENLENPVVLTRKVGDRTITFLVEPVQPGFLHACTPDDIAQVLRLLPQAHTNEIDLIVLRQPKRKQQRLSPVWGRLQYWSEIQQFEGVAIHLETHRINGIQRWHKSLAPDDAQELERLAQDGHLIVPERRHYAVHTNLSAVRATQLYRTLPHEVGHCVDYLNTTHAADGDEWIFLWNLFWSKPNRDRETFAHRYATKFWQHEKKAETIPFEQILNEEKMTAEGLSLSWFKLQDTIPVLDS